MNPEDVKMCNCAGCGIDLLGESMKDYWWSLPRKERDELPRLTRGRLGGRPYCEKCLETI